MKKRHSKNNTKNKHNKIVPSNNKIVIGKISASWCGHCVALKPIWNKIIKNPRNSHIKFIDIEKDKDAEVVDLVRINTELLPKSEEKLESNGYPTIFKITNEKLEYYKEDRDEPTINNWIHKSTPKPLKKPKLPTNYIHTARRNPHVAQHRTKRIQGGKKHNKKHNKTLHNK